MNQQGFTRRELREIFNLDPDRGEDQAAIAALRASSTRQVDGAGPRRTSRRLFVMVRRALRRRGTSLRGSGAAA
jgi:hypothetical protein